MHILFTFRALVVVKNVNILFTNSNIQISREEVDETPELHDLRNFVTEPEYETGKTFKAKIFQWQFCCSINTGFILD